MLIKAPCQILKSIPTAPSLWTWCETFSLLVCNLSLEAGKNVSASVRMMAFCVLKRASGFVGAAKLSISKHQHRRVPRRTKNTVFLLSEQILFWMNSGVSIYFERRFIYFVVLCFTRVASNSSSNSAIKCQIVVETFLLSAEISAISYKSQRQIQTYRYGKILSEDNSGQKF